MQKISQKKVKEILDPRNKNEKQKQQLVREMAQNKVRVERKN